jgi:putative FmdB family regulatory protein
VPVYEYKCENGHVFDVIQRMTDEALTECQECGAPAVRVLHSPAIHFKGSGFYNTDYGKQKKAGATSSSEGTSEKDSSSSDSSSGSDSGSSDSGSSDSSSKSSDSKSGDSKAKASTAD